MMNIYLCRYCNKRVEDPCETPPEADDCYRNEANFGRHFTAISWFTLGGVLLMLVAAALLKP